MSDPQDNEDAPPDTPPPEPDDIGFQPIPLAYATPMAGQHRPPYFFVQMLAGLGMFWGVLIVGWMGAIRSSLSDSGAWRLGVMVLVPSGLAGVIGFAIYLRVKKGWKGILPGIALAVILPILLVGACFVIFASSAGSL